VLTLSCRHFCHPADPMTEPLYTSWQSNLPIVVELLICISLRLRFWTIVSVSLSRHKVSAFTCLDVSSFPSPDRLQYDSHCVRQTAKSVPLSICRLSLIDAMQQYIDGHINETVEYRNFRCQIQQPGEPFDNYLILLWELAKTCKFCSKSFLQKISGTRL